MHLQPLLPPATLCTALAAAVKKTMQRMLHQPDVGVDCNYCNTPPEPVLASNDFTGGSERTLFETSRLGSFDRRQILRRL